MKILTPKSKKDETLSVHRYCYNCITIQNILTFQQITNYFNIYYIPLSKIVGPI